MKASAAKPLAEDAKPAAVGKLFSETMWMGMDDSFCIEGPKLVQRLHTSRLILNKAYRQTIVFVFHCLSQLPQLVYAAACSSRVDIALFLAVQPQSILRELRTSADGGSGTEVVLRKRDGKR